MSGPVDSGVPSRVRPHLIAVVTEALSNAARHARAAVVVVKLAVTDDEVTLDVTDDGDGFDSERQTRESGISNIFFRAETLGGTCTVASTPGTGTKVSWRVPVNPPSPV
jgi:signal transduction histidine kinase